MEDIEQAIQGVLNNPDMMEKIMGMAQAFGGGASQESASPQEQKEQPKVSQADLSKMAQLSGLLGQTVIDSDQQNLLNALSPYMSGKRITKLKKAMQAARLAELANTMMGKSMGQAGDGSV